MYTLYTYSIFIYKHSHVHIHIYLRTYDRGGRLAKDIHSLAISSVLRILVCMKNDNVFIMTHTCMHAYIMHSYNLGGPFAKGFYYEYVLCDENAGLYAPCVPLYALCLRRKGKKTREKQRKTEREKECKGARERERKLERKKERKNE